jgi:hypothetical protein
MNCDSCGAAMRQEETECSSCGERNSAFLSWLIDRAGESPRAALERLDALGEDYKFINGATYARIRALSRLALAAVRDSDLTKLNSRSGAELRSYITDEQWRFGLQALQLMNEIDEDALEGLGGNENTEFCTVMEQLSPGIVQAVTDWAVIGYYGSKRVKFMDDTGESEKAAEQVLLRKVLKSRISPPPILFKSAIVAGLSATENGTAGRALVLLFDEMFETPQFSNAHRWSFTLHDDGMEEFELNAPTPDGGEIIRPDGYPWFYDRVRREGLTHRSLLGDWYTQVYSASAEQERFLPVMRGALRRAIDAIGDPQYRAQQRRAIRVLMAALSDHHNHLEEGSEEAIAMGASVRLMLMVSDLLRLTPESYPEWSADQGAGGDELREVEKRRSEWRSNPPGAAVTAFDEELSDYAELLAGELPKLKVYPGADESEGWITTRLPPSSAYPTAKPSETAGASDHSGLNHPDREHLLSEFHMLLKYETKPKRRAFMEQSIAWLEGRGPRPDPALEEDTSDRAKSKGDGIGKGPVIGIAAVAGVLVLSLAFCHSKPPLTQASLPAGVTPFPSPITATLPPPPGGLNINVRNGPGTAFSSAEVLPAGSSITEMGRAIDTEGKPWIAIRRANGSYGFIKERLLTANAPSAAAQSSLPLGGVVVSNVALATDVQHGRPASDMRSFQGPVTTMGIYADYTDAHMGDLERAAVFQNGAEVTTCDNYRIPADVPPNLTASFWCQIGRLTSGSYDFVVTFNGQKVGDFPFTVT